MISQLSTYRSFWSETFSGGAWYTAWNDNHIEASTSPLLNDTKYGTVKNTVDNLYDRRRGDTQYGNVQSTGGAVTDNWNNSGVCKIVAANNDANTK